jgi:alkylation response protein AidB-like acyl-CoA dehydrogenase
LDNYGLSDEQLALRETARRMALERVAPRADEVDATACYPRDMQRLFADHDLLGLAVAEGYGGTGAGALMLALAVEALAQACASSAAIVAFQALGSLAVAEYGSEALKRRLLPDCAAGSATPGFALAEPGAGGWDVDQLGARATSDGNEWLISGEKAWVTQLGVADFYVVFARVGDGPSAFVVEADRSGVRFEPPEERLGLRGAPTGSLVLDAVRVPHANLIGAAGLGIEIAASSLAVMRRGLAALALGIAESATAYAAGYAGERRQFGQPIASFDAIASKLGEMETGCAAARELLYRACAKADRGERDARRYAAMARLACSNAAERATGDAVQILGGYGFVCDYPVERHLRDAKTVQACLGGSELQRVLVGAGR